MYLKINEVFNNNMTNIFFIHFSNILRLLRILLPVSDLIELLHQILMHYLIIPTTDDFKCYKTIFFIR